MDFVIITQNRTLFEVEIKRSWSDFIADFKKEHYHDDRHVKKFYYCVPEAMANKVQDWCKDIHVGILYYTEYHGIYSLVEPISRVPNDKIDNDEFFKLSRLATIRFWSSRMELNNIKNK